MGGPRRTCIGCRRVKGKRELMRVVRGEDGRARLDRAATASGRGAYVCPVVECVDRGLVAGRLAHAFRHPVREPLEGAAEIVDHWRGR